MGLKFGSFDSICETAALVICPMIGTDQGIEPTCYSRNVDIGGTLIFQPCTFSPPLLCFFLLVLYFLLSSALFSAFRSYFALALYVIPQLTTIYSNMFRAHCRYYHDCDYDLPHSFQVHCRGEKGDRDVLLDVHGHPASCHVPRLGHHSHRTRLIPRKPMTPVSVHKNSLAHIGPF
jgi:hypothetical protein